MMLHLQFLVTGRGPAPESAQLVFQLCLKPGQIIETSSGRRETVGTDRIEFNADALGKSIRSENWIIDIDSGASLMWPVFPYNPYRAAPETKLENAVATLTVPLALKSNPRQWLRTNERKINVRIRVNSQLANNS